MASLLDLCPTIESLQALARTPSQGQDDSTKLARLAKAILRSSSSGDVDLLAWFLDTRQRGLRGQQAAGAGAGGATGGEAALFAKLDVRTIREEDTGMGPVTLAASAGHVDAVKLLVDYGAEVDERDGGELAAFQRGHIYVPRGHM